MSCRHGQLYCHTAHCSMRCAASDVAAMALYLLVVAASTLTPTESDSVTATAVLACVCGLCWVRCGLEAPKNPSSPDSSSWWGAFWRRKVPICFSQPCSAAAAAAALSEGVLHTASRRAVLLPAARSTSVQVVHPCLGNCCTDDCCAAATSVMVAATLQCMLQSMASAAKPTGVAFASCRGSIHGTQHVPQHSRYASGNYIHRCAKSAAVLPL
jgi:hypothetical protein